MYANALRDTNVVSVVLCHVVCQKSHYLDAVSINKKDNVLQFAFNNRFALGSAYRPPDLPNGLSSMLVAADLLIGTYFVVDISKY